MGGLFGIRSRFPTTIAAQVRSGSDSATAPVIMPVISIQAALRKKPADAR